MGYDFFIALWMHGYVKICDRQIKALGNLTDHLLHGSVFLVGKDDVVFGLPRDTLDYRI